MTVGIDDTPAEAAAAGCPGTANEPKAAPGKVCLYEMGHENLDDAATGELEADGDAAWVSAYAPPDNNFGTATPYGSIVEACLRRGQLLQQRDLGRDLAVARTGVCGCGEGRRCDLSRVDRFLPLLDWKEVAWGI